MALTPQQLEAARAILTKSPAQSAQTTGSQMGSYDLDKAKEILASKSGVTPGIETGKPAGIFERIGQGITSVKEDLGQRTANVEEAMKLKREGGSGFLRTTARVGGQILGGVGDIIGEGVMTAGSLAKKTLTTQEQEAQIDEALKGAGEAIASSPIGQGAASLIKKYEALKETNPGLHADISAALGMADFASNFLGAGAAKKGVEAGVGGVIKAGAKGAESVVEAGAKLGESGLVKSVKGGIAKTGETLKQIPERIATAGETAQATAKEFAAAKPVVKKAVTAGFDMRTANEIADAAPAEKFIFRKMESEAEKLVTGKGGKEPAEIAGSFLTKRIADAEKLRKVAGEKLGASVEGLKGEIPTAKAEVLSRLQKVPGLEGLKLTNKGNLDFSGTTLSTASTASDRAIVNDFYRSIAGRDAFRLHQLRQEIFEVLGGKKAAQVQLTDTQEKALESIRQGLADSIGKVNPKYRVLNKEYAKITAPLKDLRKAYKGLEGASGDILNERSAILLRRLTSNAPSGQTLKKLIEDLDLILAKNGKPSSVNLKKLQDFMSVLDREYLELVKPGGLAGQVELGIKSATGGIKGLIGKGIDVATKKLQSTPEFRRKILKELIQ